MSYFIDWCNNNQGFWAFVLAFFSFVLSAIAIVFSIVNFINDNRKKFNVNCSILIDGSKEKNLFINVVNACNKPLGIEHISIKYDNCYLSCKCNTAEIPKLVMPAESLTLTYNLDYRYVEKCIKDDKSQLDEHFEVIVTDSMGNEHKCKKIYPAL